MKEKRSLQTRKGIITFPAYIPVTTFGSKYPLDDLIRPYLPRLAPAVMVSFFYAQQMKKEESPRIPVMIDSGGFASLFANAKVLKSEGLGIIELSKDDQVHVTNSFDVLEYQEQVADIAFTLDLPIPPGTDKEEAHKRQQLTIANAIWAIRNRRRKDLPLYACIQGWDDGSVRECAQAYKDLGFDGIAIGGLVPRSGDRKLIQEMVEAVRSEIGSVPLHAFGMGNPGVVEFLYKLGVDSVDSSSYVKMAAEGRLWGAKGKLVDPSPMERMHLAVTNLAYATGSPLPINGERLKFYTSTVHPRNFKNPAI